MQAEAPLGAVADELGSGDDFRLAVHQAAGMVSVQLGIPVDDALARLRAFAFAAEQSVPEVAHRIVARQLRLER